MQPVGRCREYFAELKREDVPTMKAESVAGLLVAVVDDDDLYREYISEVLSSQGNCRVFGAESSAAMLKILDNNPIDCILLDYNMGAESGLTIGELIKNRYSDPPPIVMLTGEGKERTVIKAFRIGFSDFVSKQNMNLDELAGAIRGAADRKMVERAEKKERDRLVRLSRFDSLTGLHTAEFMKERLEDLAASAQRRDSPCGVIVIHLPELESIGDAFGYVIRDRALRIFAARLQKATREADICGRHGEDSFLYLIDREASPHAVNRFCYRLARDLSFEANFDKAGFTFAPSIGAALFPFDGTSAEELLAAAAQAHARARLNGASFAPASPLPEEGNGSDPSALDSDDSAAAEVAAIESPSLIGNRQSDRRRDQRHRVLKRGKIVVSGADPVFDCMIRNLSNKGARLRLDDYYAPPEQFDLLIVDSGEKRSANVRWRVGNEIGIQFVP
jgi:two-component system cell cycle response regulator